MNGKTRRLCVLAALCALVTFCATRAREEKPADEGKAEDFKGKTFDLKEKQKGAVILAFPAGKEAAASVRCDKKTDVNLFVYDAAGKLVVKDDSPGPDCDVKFTPKEAGKFKLEVLNLGPGDNKATLKVTLAK
jgi:hypothetical protein